MKAQHLPPRGDTLVSKHLPPPVPVGHPTAGRYHTGQPIPPAWQGIGGLSSTRPGTVYKAKRQRRRALGKLLMFGVGFALLVALVVFPIAMALLRILVL